MPAYSTTANGYNNLWNKAAINSTDAALKVHSTNEIIIKNRSRYEEAGRRIGHPELWPLIAALHWRESSGNFNTQLAQGDPLHSVSVHEPDGMGPYDTWEDGAEAALRLKGWQNIKEWPISRQLYEAERYNGFGYFSRGVNSPYVWAATTLQQPGKYIADGVWSSTTWDKQLGVAAILIDLLPRINVVVPEKDEVALWADKVGDVLEQMVMLWNNRPEKLK